AVVLTGFGPGGCGRGHGFHGGHGRDPAAMAAFVQNRVDDALDELDATPAQRERIQGILKGLVADAQALRGGHEADHAELVALWNADAPDAAKLHALVDERSAAMTAFAHRVADAAVEVHATLTPEQRAEVSRKLERRMGER
ncbi:MAG TPA: Spy/CpxP family protein refolding chaperone, partial [Anaeromyxobacteraceae bacterium]|nr:Spy/CpxP family protein refolding chaperone [Anaeromyxobacteraceae bacterium]